jgi:hypothetical protein
MGKIRLYRIILVFGLFLGTIYANFYAINRLERHIVELHVYDKLAVAYDLAGKSGFERELEKIISRVEARQQMAVARDFQISIRGLDDPESFLDAKLAQVRERISFLKFARNAAIAVVVILFFLQVALSLKLRRQEQ